jgi:hypothetical protein
MDHLCGHRDGSAGSVYVHGVSVEALRDAVERLQFDGFDIAGLKAVLVRLAPTP